MEEIRSHCSGLELLNEDVYMATTFEEFLRLAVLKSRGHSTKKEFVYDAVNINFTQ